MYSCKRWYSGHSMMYTLHDACIPFIQDASIMLCILVVVVYSLYKLISKLVVGTAQATSFSVLLSLHIKPFPYPLIYTTFIGWFNIWFILQLKSASCFITFDFFIREQYHNLYDKFCFYRSVLITIKCNKKSNRI